MWYNHITFKQTTISRNLNNIVQYYMKQNTTWGRKTVKSVYYGRKKFYSIGPGVLSTAALVGEVILYSHSLVYIILSVAKGTHN
jgi:hypothetical protein